MGAKALGIVLAVFQVLAGGTRPFYFVFFYIFFSSFSYSYSSSFSSSDKATTNGKLGSLSCSPTLLRNVGISCYSRVVAEIMITVRSIPWLDLLHNRPALKPKVYGHVTVNVTQMYVLLQGIQWASRGTEQGGARVTERCCRQQTTSERRVAQVTVDIFLFPTAINRLICGQSIIFFLRTN